MRFSSKLSSACANRALLLPYFIDICLGKFSKNSATSKILLFEKNSSHRAAVYVLNLVYTELYNNFSPSTASINCLDIIWKPIFGVNWHWKPLKCILPMALNVAPLPTRSVKKKIISTSAIYKRYLFFSGQHTHANICTYTELNFLFPLFCI